MGTDSLETKSLPRNRKCGNCRHFEPAPLWRKGWCRNIQLYPVQANHLVDSTSLDCETGFRSRIYWEPLPEGNAGTNQNTHVVNFQERVTQAVQPVQTKGANFKPGEYSPEEEDIPPAPPPLRVSYNRLPTLPRDQVGWRAELRNRFPFTENWPLEKIESVHLILWGSAIFLLLIASIVIFSGGDKNSNAKLTESNALIATQNAQSSILMVTTAAPVITPVTSNAPAVTASTVKSNTPPAADDAPKTIIGKTGKVVNLDGDSLNVRQDSSTSAKIIVKVKEGSTLKIIGGPRSAEGLVWYQVDVNGQVGWASNRYIAIQ